MDTARPLRSSSEMDGPGGQQRDDVATQSRRARTILHDHIVCIVAIGAVLVLQLLPA